MTPAIFVAIGQVAVSIATGIIACLVYLLTKSQAKQTNIYAAQQKAISIQSFRLALLDRRSTVCNQIDEVWFEWSRNARPTREMIRKAYEALEAAKFIFPEALVVKINETINLLTRVNILQSRAGQWLEVDPHGKYQETIEKQFVCEDELHPKLTALRLELIASSRILEPA